MLWPVLACLALCSCTNDKPPAGPTADTAAVADATSDPGVAPQLDVIVAPDASAETTADLAPEDSPDAAKDSEPVDTAPADIVAPGTPCTTNADCPDPGIPCSEARCEVSVHTCKLVQALDNTACSDGQTCTVGDLCKGGACVPGKAACGCTADSDCAFLDDTNLCNGSYACDKTKTPSVCTPKASSAVVCPPTGSPCLVNLCNPTTGACDATPTNQGGPCEDGKLCTQGDACDSGKCIAGPSTCQCLTASDCKDDGNLCNGVPYCDKGELPWTCKTNPGTVVQCATTNDTACMHNQCNAQTGVCQPTPINEGGPCKDDDFCTASDTCKGGVCKGGPNVCGCQSDGDCAKAEDGNLCNGTLFCNKTVAPHLCQVNPATVVVCPSANDTVCHQNLCSPATGKCAVVLAKDGTACDDGNACTPDDACQAGDCVAKTNLCPCNASSDCAKKDDGDLCNGTLYCDKSKLPYVCQVNPATVVTCPSAANTTCLHNLCAKATGLCAPATVNEQSACEADGNPCTVGDVCASGSCKAGPNNCPCQQDGDCAKAEDGNPCNGSLYCDKGSGTCKVNPNTVVVCPTTADTTCLANQCSPATGKCALTPRHQSQPCDADGNPCTEGDVCDKGQCVAGANTCACKASGDCAPFEDGNKCNGTLYCDTAKVPFACKVNPATVVTCGVGAPPKCQVNACDPGTGKCGLVPVVDQSVCEDGSLCTVGDACTAGKCVPGTDLCGCYSDVDCASKDDGNACNGQLYCDKAQLPYQCKTNPNTVVVCPATQDGACLQAVCDPKNANCLLAAVGDGGACTDGNPCTSADVCSKGGCVGKVTVCNDGDACSLDDCDVVDGCLASANGAAACNDGNACTADLCDKGSGCSYQTLNATACSDGNPCTGIDGCVKGTCVGQPGGGCDDDNPCTDDSCASDGVSCLHQATEKPCAEGRLCQQGRCGGCEAWRRIARTGCSRVALQSNSGNCGYTFKGKREELEDAALLDDGRVLAVGAAGAVTNTQATAGWAVWHLGNGQWQQEKLYGVNAADRLLGVAAAGKGGAWLCGSGQGAGATLRPWLVRVDATGNAVGNLLLPPPAGTLATDQGQFDDVAALPDGGALAVGRIDNAKAGAADAVLARVDATGKVVWSLTLGQETGSQTPVVDHLWAVALAPDGLGFAVAGQRGHPKAPAQQQDGWLARLDLAGNVQWSKSFGGTQYEALYDVAWRSDGSLVAAGTRNKATALGSGDGWLLQVDGKGQLQTQWTAPDDGDERLHTVGLRSDGGVVALGTRGRNHTGDKAWVAGDYDLSNALAIAFDPTGKMVWQREFDEYGSEVAEGGVVLPFGDALLAGTSRVDGGAGANFADGLLLRIDGGTGEAGCPCQFFADLAESATPSDLPGLATLDGDGVVAVGFEQGQNGTADGWLRALEATGKPRWDKVLAKPGTDKLRAVARGEKGTWLAVGQSDSAGAGNADGWSVLFDAKGAVLADKTTGGPEDDVLQAVAGLPNGGWVAAGYSYTASKGGADGWIVGLDASGNKLWEHRQGRKYTDWFTGVALAGWGPKARAVVVGWSVDDTTAGLGVDEMVTVLEQDGSVALSKAATPLQYYYDQVNGYNGKDKGWDELFAAARQDDGGVVAVGRSGGFPYPYMLIVRYDANGEAVSHHSRFHGNNNVPVTQGIQYGVAPVAGGGFVAVGMKYFDGPDSVGTAMAVGFDADDVKQWSEADVLATAGGNNQRLLAVVRTASGQVAVSGTAKYADGSTRGIVARIDPAQGQSGYESGAIADGAPCQPRLCDGSFGARSVRAATTCDDLNRCRDADRCVQGVCAGALLHNCDDGNPCTADTCSAAAGCLVTAANDGQMCSKATACLGGNCGACALPAVTFGSATQHEYPQALVPTAGGWWLAGYAQIGTGKETPWLAKVGADLVPTAQLALNVAPGHARLQALVPMMDGGLWAAGWGSTSTDLKQPSYDGLLLRIDNTSKVTNTVWPAETYHQKWQMLVALADGTLVAGGNTVNASATVSRLRGHDAAGKALWTLDGKVTQGMWHEATATTDGGVLAVGTDGANERGLATRLDAGGSVLWVSSLGAASSTSTQAIGVFAMPDGSFAAALQRTVGSNTDLAIVRWSASGAVVSQILVPYDGDQFLQSAVLAGTAVVAAGYADDSKGTEAALLTRVGLVGDVQWEAAFAQGGALLAALRPRADGTWLAAGHIKVGANDERQAYLRVVAGDGKGFCGP